MYVDDVISLLGEPVKKNIKTGQYFYNCPFSEHEDEQASFNINIDDGRYFCFGCGRHGHFKKLYKHIRGKEHEEIIDEDIINSFHENLINNKDKIKELKEYKFINLNSIKLFKIGWNGERYTFPVKKGKYYINMIMYMLNAPQEKPKVIPYKVGLNNTLYNINNITKSPKSYIMEGITDCINAIQCNLNATTQLYGAENWSINFNNYFKDREVVIVYDNDKAGETGSLLVANSLSNVAKTIKIISFKDHKKGYDFTDFIKESSIDKFHKLEKETSLFNIKNYSVIKDNLIEVDYKDVDVSEVNSKDLVLKKINFTSKVRGKALTPYLLPKDISFNCSPQDQKCFSCKLYHFKGDLNVKIQSDSPDVIELIDCTRKSQELFLTDKYNIKKNCPVLNISINEFANLEKLSLGEVVDFKLETKSNKYIVLSAYSLDTNVESNQIYNFKGLTVPHPRTQQSVQIILKADPGKTSLDGFVLTEDDINNLKIFQPVDTIEDKLNEIYKDITYNVTRIWKREDLLLFMDLIYHSVIRFKFQKISITRGWIEGLAIGDTRVGKSETAQKILNHYKAGEMSTTEKASFAGLIGALQQIGDSWMVTWGKFPMNDMRLYIIDETSGLALEDIELMSGVRSSGIAEIVKVHQERTFARTRKIWLSNPRAPYPLNSYNTGVEAIAELIGKPEDISRFDLAITLAEDEVPIEIINRGYLNKVHHIYTSELCHKLIMWAWTLKEENIFFTKEAENKCLEWAFKLSAKYTSVIPLVHSSEQRIKIARLSVALAARLFSTNDGINLIIKEEHVDYVCNFLMKLYDKPSMGYNVYSMMKGEFLGEDDKEALINILVGQEYSEDLLTSMLYTKFIRLSDIENFTGLDRSDCKTILSLLVRKKALIAGYNALYRKTPGFITLIKDLLKKGALNGGHQNTSIRQSKSDKPSRRNDNVFERNEEF